MAIIIPQPNTPAARALAFWQVSLSWNRRNEGPDLSVHAAMLWLNHVLRDANSWENVVEKAFRLKNDLIEHGQKSTIKKA